MVYSATSATALLQGEGDGSSYLIKFVAYGAVGLVVMRVLARDGVAKAQTFVAPLLAVSFGLVLAVHIPHIGVSVNGARRWIGPSQLQFQPSELLKLALVLYGATLLARRPPAGARPARAGQAAADRRGGRLSAGGDRARSRDRDDDRVHDRCAARGGRHPGAQPGDHRRCHVWQWCSCTRSPGRMSARG